MSNNYTIEEIRGLIRNVLLSENKTRNNVKSLKHYILNCSRSQLNKLITLNDQDLLNEIAHKDNKLVDTTDFYTLSITIGTAYTIIKNLKYNPQIVQLFYYTFIYEDILKLTPRFIFEKDILDPESFLNDLIRRFTFLKVKLKIVYSTSSFEFKSYSFFSILNNINRQFGKELVYDLKPYIKFTREIIQENSYNLRPFFLCYDDFINEPCYHVYRTKYFKNMEVFIYKNNCNITTVCHLIILLSFFGHVCDFLLTHLKFDNYFSLFGLLCRINSMYIYYYPKSSKISPYFMQSFEKDEYKRNNMNIIINENVIDIGLRNKVLSMIRTLTIS